MKKNLKYILIVLICLIFSINGIQAKSYIKNLFQADDNLKIQKELDGTAFLAGSDVEINELINGIGFIAGKDIEINHEQEYIITAGETININNNIEKDLFIAGQTININNATLKRDAYIAGDKVELNGVVERNIYIYATNVELKGTYNGNVTIYASDINIDKDATINGTLKYNKNSIVSKINDKIKTKQYELNSKKLTFKDYITSFLSSYIHMVILAITLVFICEKIFSKSLKQTKDLSVKSGALLCGKGLLILIGVPLLALMLLLSGLFSSVGIIGGIIYGILVYIAEIFTAYTITDKLDKKYFKKDFNSYLLVIIGLFIIRIIGFIPVLGGLLSFLILIFGLGIVGNMIIELKK